LAEFTNADRLSWEHHGLATRFAADTTSGLKQQQVVTLKAEHQERASGAIDQLAAPQQNLTLSAKAVKETAGGGFYPLV
jgi:hypothetical protein